jgi:hypothetical protein
LVSELTGNGNGDGSPDLLGRAIERLAQGTKGQIEASSPKRP